jgi:obg-like ATPase 1
MSPKKAPVDNKAQPWMLGKFSSKLKVGLVGFPNVGKSTLYNSLSKSHHAEAAPYPFCTIGPSETRALVEDARFDWLVEHEKPAATVPAFLTVVDIAGLIKGCSQGAGLGNEFLANIKDVDGIIHVMRAFEDPDVPHAEDKVDPVADIDVITSELRIKDIEFMKNKLEAHERARTASATKSPAALKAWEEEKAAMIKFIAWMEDGKDIRNGMSEWTTKDIDYLNEYRLLTAKPAMFAVNLTFEDFKRKKNKWLKPIFEWVQKNSSGSVIIPYSGAWESKCQDLEGDELKTEIEGAGMTLDTFSSLAKMKKTAFNMINLIYFFTYGPKEVKAWVIRNGWTAPKAAGTIHGDIEHGFICADVMAFEELKAAGSQAEMKKTGKYRQEGKNYVVQDGDVILFKHNAPKSAANKK